MPIDITIPSPGESITEVVLGPWHKTSGEWVSKDEALVEIESDKITLELPAAESGVLEIKVEEGAQMQVGEVIGTIDPNGAAPASAGVETADASSRPDPAEPAAATRGESVGAAPVDPTRANASAPARAVEVATATASAAGGEGQARATSLAKKVAAHTGVPLDALSGTGPSGRITKSDVLAATRADATAGAAVPARTPPPVVTLPAATRGVRRQRLSTLRLRIAQRLVEAQHQAAMLTTFNEVDMTEVMRLRAEHKESFQEKHGVGLGFMSFFVKSCVSALQLHQGVNAYIVGNEVEYHDYVDVSVAVGTPRGLVVPVLRDAHLLSFAQIETGIKDLALRARDGALTIEDMTGGTFTISNGGVYGSLMSTPILNPPQSGILGMHKIMKRAVEDPNAPGTLALRPMMYLALSYDHRIVDGEQAVRFLVHVKDLLEAPERMLLGV